MIGKFRWKKFIKEIEKNIEKLREELDKLSEKQLIEKFGYGKNFNAIRKGIMEKIELLNESRKLKYDPRERWDEIVEEMKACKNMRELKQLKYEAEAKYWIKLKKRDKIA